MLEGESFDFYKVQQEPTIFHFGLYWAWRTVDELNSDQSADHVKP